MQQKIVPCLWFDGQAEEATRYYVSVFEDAEILDIHRIGDEGQVLTTSFRIAGQEYMALNGGPEFRFSEATSFFVRCADQEEVDYFWNTLTADGGEESQCGWLKDKFGLSWQIIPNALVELVSDPDRERANRVMQALLQMTKIDIPTLERAYEGG
ncbi:MAG TPA: VOC family protein [Thermomicrobiales bacterium]|nr:VOC family protein [Thermomicrobiales bacterium]